MTKKSDLMSRVQNRRDSANLTGAFSGDLDELRMLCESIEEYIAAVVATGSPPAKALTVDDKWRAIQGDQGISADQATPRSDAEWRAIQGDQGLVAADAFPQPKPLNPDLDADVEFELPVDDRLR